MGSGDQRVNRVYWDAYAAEYQQEHRRTLSKQPLAWGVWRIPEDELGALGDVKGRDLLELGCGGGQWSAALIDEGARPVGLDLSGEQLAHVRRTAPTVPALQADAEVLPFRAESFDVVFCDHGGMTFADPLRVVPEVARVLRPGGLLAFCIGSPLLLIAIDPTTDEVTDRLHADWFGMHRFDWDHEVIEYQLPYGEWLSLFHDHGLDVEGLHHLRPPPRARTTYDMVPYAWARRWPAEDLWRARKPVSP